MANEKSSSLRTFLEWGDITIFVISFFMISVSTSVCSEVWFADLTAMEGWGGDNELEHDTRSMQLSDSSSSDVLQILLRLECEPPSGVYVWGVLPENSLIRIITNKRILYLSKRAALLHYRDTTFTKVGSPDSQSGHNLYQSGQPYFTIRTQTLPKWTALIHNRDTTFTKVGSLLHYQDTNVIKVGSPILLSGHNLYQNGQPWFTIGTQLLPKYAAYFTIRTQPLPKWAVLFYYQDTNFIKVGSPILLSGHNLYQSGQAALIH